MADLQLLRPTNLVVVPRLMNKIHDGIHFKMRQEGPKKYAFFQKALAAKIEKLREDGSVTHPEYDKMLFDKLKMSLGGRVETMTTGSAPIQRDVLEFMRVVFAAKIIEGYGQTESSAGSFMTGKEERTCGHVGGVMPSVEFKLEDVPELGYLHTDKPCPRGEVCLRGPAVIPGYFKKPEKTKETIDERGWLHTGDIGELQSGGRLRLVDRKKNIFKLSQGEYIAPEKIEAVLQTAPLVQQAFVDGNSLRDHVVAVVVPDEEVVMLVAKKAGLEGDFKTLCAGPALRGMLAKQIAEAGEKANLNGLERVGEHFHVCAEPWLPGGLLTPTLKLKRDQARKAFAKELEALYA